jgi:peptidoglycan/xylan/chitin deacetylase (PgdA/CDA1 family)
VTVFAASHPFSLFDEARIPYRLTVPGPDGTGDAHRQRPIPPGCGAIWIDGDEGGRTWYWPRAGEITRGVARLGSYRLGEIHLVGHVVPEPAARGLLRELGHGWTVDVSISTPEGRTAGAILRADDGSIFLPFDPEECMTNLRSERYRQLGRSELRSRAKAAVLRAYYLVRPVLPRRVQLGLRRAVARIQRPPDFPRWPVEPSLHDLADRLMELTSSFAGAPVPWIDVWPGGHRWAAVLTHDVEARAGYADLALLRDLERDAGLRSSWNFVPLREPRQARYEVGEPVLHMLAREGCEIGVHGLHHDGRDLESLEMLRERLPAIREYAQRWGAVGFRAPATQRAWEWMPLLAFDYDSSSPDSDPYEPIPGGCCSWLPFFNDGMVELPITLPQDHTLFAILGHPDGSMWMDKARVIRDRGGMVLVLTHPDYARDPVLREAYRALLAWVREDDSVWHAVPREVSDWWRRRSDSWLEATDAGWVIRGPAAADARIRWTGGPPAQPPFDARAVVGEGVRTR